MKNIKNYKLFENENNEELTLLDIKYCLTDLTDDYTIDVISLIHPYDNKNFMAIKVRILKVSKIEEYINYIRGDEFSKKLLYYGCELSSNEIWKEEYNQWSGLDIVMNVIYTSLKMKKLQIYTIKS